LDFVRTAPILLGEGLAGVSRAVDRLAIVPSATGIASGAPRDAAVPASHGTPLGTRTSSWHFGHLPRLPACSSRTRNENWHAAQVTGIIRRLSTTRPCSFHPFRPSRHAGREHRTSTTRSAPF